LGWLDAKKYFQTKDEEHSQGWTTFILDTNGNGKRDAWTDPGQPIDPTKDARIQASYYGYIQSPIDYSVWGASWDSPFPGMIIRTTLGSNPPETTLSEKFDAPTGDPKKF